MKCTFNNIDSESADAYVASWIGKRVSDNSLTNGEEVARLGCATDKGDSARVISSSRLAVEDIGTRRA